MKDLGFFWARLIPKTKIQDVSKPNGSEQLEFPLEGGITSIGLASVKPDGVVWMSHFQPHMGLLG